MILRRKLVASVDVHEKAYEKGYIQGAKTGWRQGRKDGFKEGYEKGFREGYKKGREAEWLRMAEREKLFGSR